MSPQSEERYCVAKLNLPQDSPSQTQDLSTAVELSRISGNDLEDHNSSESSISDSTAPGLAAIKQVTLCVSNAISGAQCLFLTFANLLAMKK